MIISLTFLRLNLTEDIMGLWISKLMNVFADFAQSGKESRILMLGLDAAGKLFYGSFLFIEYR